MRIAVLDIDTDRANHVCATLKAIGHACHLLAPDSSPDGIRRDDIDLLILDLQALRANNALRSFRSWLPGNTPALFMAERTDEDELVSLPEDAQCDYIIKPIRLGELATRVRVLLKKAYPEQAACEQVIFGPYAFETSAGRVSVAGRLIDITRKEFELALLLFRNLGRPLSRATIQEAIWSQEPQLASRTMDTHVSRVRSKLGLRPENGFRLAPVYGYGYQLERLGE
ncbi:MAG TPA: response regulator transcription factor [Noviherbaspirillum sp.]